MNQVPFKRLTDADLNRLEQEGGELVLVRDGHEPMIVMRLADWRGMDETTYLLSDPVNKEMLLRSIAEADAGKLTEHELIEP
jgi:antitoxin YefM